MADPQERQTPWFPVVGHLSGSGTYQDAPTPPGVSPSDQTDTAIESKEER